MGMVETSLVVGIVTHPKRLEQATALQAETNAEVMVIDHESRGEKWCHATTLEQLAAHDADWLILLEDDAIPCADFRETVSERLSQAPSKLVSLYLGTGRWAGKVSDRHWPIIRELTHRADAEQARWIVTHELWHAVGLAIRRDMAAEILGAINTSSYPTDLAISAHTSRTRTQVAYTWPSLVDHQDSERIVITSDQPTIRRAVKFLGGHAHVSPT